MNETISQMYEHYRGELNTMIDLFNSAPQRFDNNEFAQDFQIRFEKASALASLFAGMMSQRKKKKGIW